MLKHHVFLVAIALLLTAVGIACSSEQPTPIPPEAFAVVATPPPPPADPHAEQRQRALLIVGREWTGIPEFRVQYPGAPFGEKDQHAGQQDPTGQYYDAFARPRQGGTYTVR